MGEKDFSDRALVGDDSLSFVSRDVFRSVRSGVTDPIARATSRLEYEVTGFASSRTRPRVGASRPSSNRTSVDLPEPFGQITASISPELSSNDTPFRTSAPDP